VPDRVSVITGIGLRTMLPAISGDNTKRIPCNYLI
jgi:hypothetical protein